MVIQEIKDFALENKIPIMSDGGIDYLKKDIKENNIKNILEIGTAIAYSAIMMCEVSDDIIVTTIEKDEERYLEAFKNITELNLEERINLIYQDALEVVVDSKYDLIFIDAAKAQNKKLFERFESNLKSNGTIITDNMNFHGLVNLNLEEIHSRDLRQLVRKIKEYKIFLEENENYVTEFLDIGDGLAISKRNSKKF